ncbi:hypothetical protein CEXT_606981 [Caerostris extrusa]|uniref:Uncharacterized protein n=1 Tax=Caerostris extrusa TaxID=172846 RepID=A0AAV4UQJ8_CAEEX|nr:hypothetical protein CEXT_606981 [Caerostris extrusa]
MALWLANEKPKPVPANPAGSATHYLQIRNEPEEIARRVQQNRAAQKKKPSLNSWSTQPQNFLASNMQKRHLPSYVGVTGKGDHTQKKEQEEAVTVTVQQRRAAKFVPSGTEQEEVAGKWVGWHGD